MIDTAEEVRACQEAVRSQGYGILPGVLNDDERERALALVREWHERTRDLEIDGLPYLAADSPIIWNLHYKDPYFLDLFLRNSAIEQVLIHFLNDPWYKGLPPDEPNYILRAMVARSSVDTLALHIDNFVPYEGPTVISLQAALALEGMTPGNGATIAVPGSHLSGRYVDPERDLPDAVPIVADPGDLVVWDSRLWHGAGANTGPATRWTITATFTRWWIKQAFRVTERLPEEIYAHLTDREKAILGFCSIGYFDEREGIDQRRGHEALRARVADYRRPEAPPDDG